MSLSQVIDWAKDFAQNYYQLGMLILTGLGLLLGVKMGHLWRVWDKIKALVFGADVQYLKSENQRLTATLNRVRAAFDDHNNIWLRKPEGKPTGYHSALETSIPILLVANLKGGVGKTTIAANLAVYFERREGERVLAIDLDHQGSLSSMLLPEEVQRDQRPADAVKGLIGGAENAITSLFSESVFIRGTQRGSRLVDCTDGFANFETRILLEWLIGDLKGDVRYNLARVLHSPEVRQHFDRVIIDAPPRMTTGFVNALCASTHLIVPFVLDGLSAERVGLFLRTVRRMRGQLFPHLELGGVVGTMKGDGTQKLRPAEEEAIGAAERGVKSNWGPGDYVLKGDALIPRRQSIADAAGLGVDLEVAHLFNPLGRQLFKLTTSRPRKMGSQLTRAALKHAQGGSAHESQVSARATQQF